MNGCIGFGMLDAISINLSGLELGFSGKCSRREGTRYTHPGLDLASLLGRKDQIVDFYLILKLSSK